MKTVLPIVAILLFSFSSALVCQTGKTAAADQQTRAESLSHSCSSEFDNPASPEYKECTEAIILYKKLTAERPRDIPLLLKLARLYENRSREMAISTYEKVLELDKESVAAHFALSELSEKPDAQIEHLQQVIRLNPNHQEAHGRLAWLLASGPNISDAVTEAKLQISVNPQAFDIIANAVQKLWDGGHKTEAGEVLETYLRSSVAKQVKCKAPDAMSIKNYSDQPSVLDTFKKECSGYLLYDQSLKEEEPLARAQRLEQAIKEGNTDPRAHGELALALLQLNDVGKAMTEIKEQIKRDPILGQEQIINFATALRNHALLSDSDAVYLAYLNSPAPNEIVCPPVRKLLSQSEPNSDNLRQAYQNRCERSQAIDKTKVKN